MAKLVKQRELKTRGERIFDVFNVILCCFLMFIFIYPFWDTLILSISNNANASKMGLRIFPYNVPIFDAYEKVFAQKKFLTAFRNSVLRSVIGTVYNVSLTFMAAYVLAKRGLPGKGIFTGIIMFTMFFGGGLIPTYMNYKQLGLLNTFWMYILPSACAPFHIFIARNFIIGIPDSIEEAATIDGSGALNTMIKVIAPMCKPIISVLAMWVAIGQWNAWYDAYIYVRKEELIVLQLLLRRVIVENDTEAMGQSIAESTQETTPATVKAATIMVTTIPIVCIYPFFQKYFVKGINLGAVKG